MQPNSHVAGQRTEGRRPQAAPIHAGARPTKIVAHHLAPADIALDVAADNKAQVFAEVARRAEHRHGVSRQAVYEALCAREGHQSTALGRGIAVPHARVSGLRNVIAMFLRTRHALEFDAPDGKPVSQMFVLLVPEDANERHLQLLAETAQLFCDRGFRERLAAATDAESVYQLFAEGPGD